MHFASIPLHFRRDSVFVQAVHPSSTPLPASPGPTPLMLFRGEGRAPRPLHPLEKALLIVTGIHMCFLPWALGGMTFTPWPLWISLGLGVVGLLLALWPRNYTEAQ